jgi:multidrug efflux pump
VTFTDHFVQRPVLALVISSLMVLSGLFALNKLPLRQYPMLENATITITT